MATTVDLRPLLGPVRQSPFRGTCVAFALTAVHNKAAAIAPAGLSVEALYWGAKQHDVTASPGTTFEPANTALTTWGPPCVDLWARDSICHDAVVDLVDDTRCS